MGAGASAANAELISNATPDEIKASFEALPSEQQARFLQMMEAADPAVEEAAAVSEVAAKDHVVSVSESPNAEPSQAAEDASAAPEASAGASAPAMEEAPASASVPQSGSEVQVGEGEKTAPAVVQEAQACDAPPALEEVAAPPAVEEAAAIEGTVVADEKATPPVITEAAPLDESAAAEEKAVAAVITEGVAVDSAPAAADNVAPAVGEGTAADEFPAVKEALPASEEVAADVKSAPAEEGTKENELTEEQSANLQKTFDAIDTNKNGAIEASEFKKACELFGLPVSETWVKDTFAKFDVNHDAKIDLAEFTRLIVEAVSQ